MTISNYGPAPVLDIASFAFRQLFRHMRNVLILMLPLLLLNAALGGLSQNELMDFQARHQVNPNAQVGAAEAFSVLGDSILSSLVMMLTLGYLAFVLMKYVRDVYQRPNDMQPLLDYLRPSKELYGYLLLGLIMTATAMVYVGAIVLGLILLIIPGLALIGFGIFVVCRLYLTNVSYFMAPDEGVIAAFKKSWTLTRGHVLRIVGLLFMIALLTFMIRLPFAIIAGLYGGFRDYMIHSGSWMNSPLLAAGNIAYTGLLFSLEVLTTIGGGTFTMYRFYHDVIARRDALPLIPAAPNPSDAPWA